MKKVYWMLCFVLLLAGQGWAHGEKGLKGVKVVSLAKTSESWNGKALPSYPKGKPQITILKITIGPKVRLPLHKHPVINAGVLLKGKLTVITEKGETLHGMFHAVDDFKVGGSSDVISGIVGRNTPEQRIFSFLCIFFPLHIGLCSGDQH